jgi:amidase
VRARVRAVAQALADQGAEIDDQARPQFSAEHSHETFEALLASAMAARIPQADFDRMRAIAEAAPASDQSPLARQARWQTMSAREWGQRNEARTALRWAWQRFFQRFDLVITPIMPTTAFAHDHGSPGKRRIRIDGEEHPYFCQTFWAGLAGVSLLPATVIPGGLSAEGLPIGVQLIGPAYSDLKLIQIAQRLEQLGFAFRSPPGMD